MANRHFQQHQYSLEKKIVDLYAQALVAADGSVTLSNSKGITRISTDATGVYTVVFDAAYRGTIGVMGLKANVICATGVPAAPIVFLVSRSATGCVFQTNAMSDTSAALAAAYPAVTEVMLLHFTLSDAKAL